MSFRSASGPKQPVAQNSQVDHPAGPNLADFFRLRQMEKMVKQTAKELERVKTRLSRLEKTLACENDKRPVHEASVPPLSVAELKQLAEMAKRFR